MLMVGIPSRTRWIEAAAVEPRPRWVASCTGMCVAAAAASRWRFIAGWAMLPRKAPVEAASRTTGPRPMTTAMSWVGLESGVSPAERPSLHDETDLVVQGHQVAQGRAQAVLGVRRVTHAL